MPREPEPSSPVREVRSIAAISPVIPVVVINDAVEAVPLAQALHAGGISIIEVTLRTRAASEAIERIRDEVPDVTVGAGTLLEPAHVEQARNAGAQFLVSPGATRSLCEAAIASQLPFIPGVATSSEMLSILDLGLTMAKFFPAQAAGGTRYLRAVGEALPQLSFCPTGGITEENAGSWLALSNVLCVGGSWLAQRDAICARDWASVTALAMRASRLGLEHHKPM